MRVDKSRSRSKKVGRSTDRGGTQDSEDVAQGPLGPVDRPLNPPPATDVDAPPVDNLWEQAFRALKDKPEFGDYVTRYERILIGINDLDEPTPPQSDRQDQMVALIDTQTARLKDSRWGWVISGRKVYAAEVVDKIVKGIIYAKGAVESILRGSGEPHAAMAWAGVCLLLPVCVNGKNCRTWLLTR